MKYKDILCGMGAAIGGAVSYLWGGWSMDLITLVIFMSIDFLTGLIVAGIFRSSNKTAGGALSSDACFKGLAKKVMILIFVAVAHMLDRYIGVTFLRGAVIAGFLLNELISIVENAGRMGITSPAINKAIEILKKKKDDDDDKE